MKKSLLMIMPWITVIIVNQGYAQQTETGLMRKLTEDSVTARLAKGLGRTGQQIRIGDKVPECYFKMVHYGAPDLRLSDLRGKWVILDFWSNGCGSCIANMPRLERLQQGYEQKLMIIPITFESAGVAAETLQWVADKYRLDTAPASIVEDTTTYSLFSSYMNPLEVWIDPWGKLAAITGLEYVTRENIEAAMDNKPLHFPDYSRKEQRFNLKDKATVDTVEYGSVIKESVGYPDNLRILRAAANAKTIYGYFLGIAHLYSTAYHYLDPEKVTTMEGGKTLDRWVMANFNVDGSYDSTYCPGSYTPLNNHNLDTYKNYVYELNMPDGTSKEEMGKKMLSDLDIYFNVKSAIKKEKVKTLALVKLKDGQVSSGDTVEYLKRLKAEGIVYVTYDAGISDIVDILNGGNYCNLPHLVIYNKTGVNKQKVTINLFRTMTMKDLRGQLKAYGLDMVPGEDREMDMLVLTKLSKPE